MPQSLLSVSTVSPASLSCLSSPSVTLSATRPAASPLPVEGVLSITAKSRNPKTRKIEYFPE
jgi:hypothetical protein